ncbi:MAG TPA: ion channel [Candidatus Angelobacter sp.]|nr:ion channel [Candidatus Angelobacter sp.]
MDREAETISAGIDTDSRDLGFGSVLSGERALRLLNRDGSFNVRRHKASPIGYLFSFHSLLTMPGWAFLTMVVAIYLVLNTLFACAYLLCGPGALQGASSFSGFWQAFFFSIDTFSTIGYGNIVPNSFGANMLVTIEAVVGLLSFALATGVVFARFARPVANVIYSKKAVIAPYRGISSFQFRIINGRDNQLIDLYARLILTRFEDNGESRERKYYQLPLERTHVAFFPLAWTIVHPIQETSPLFGWDEAQLRASRAEFLILLTGIDETFAQNVNSRSSYAADEIVWGGKFAKLFQEHEKEGVPTIDMKKFDCIDCPE